MIIDFKSPIVIRFNTDSNGNAITEPIINESKQVINQMVVLDQIPNKLNRILITGYTEIEQHETLTLATQFRCNYQNGILTFHSSKEGNTINIDSYAGRGIIYTPSTRIYTNLDGIGNVNQTLYDLIAITYKTPVSTFTALSTIYPTPEKNWTAQCEDTGKFYKWSGSAWEYISILNSSQITQLNNDIDNLAGTGRTTETVKGNSDNINEINNKLDSGTINSPTFIYGMNGVITHTGEVIAFPGISFTGMTIVNLLGKDGDCEDVSKWSGSSATLSLDSTNKIFGSNGIKITLTSTAGSAYKTLSTLNVDVSKYYMMSAYLKNGNATNVRLYKSATGGGVSKSGPFITDTTAFTRTVMKLQPSDLNVANTITLYVTGASTQYAYADGVMFNEISAADYALTESELLAKYPYVESYAALQNPYFENRRYNMIRNGNGEEGVGYWILHDSSVTLSIENDRFKIVTTAASLVKQKIKVKLNTDYYFTANVTGSGVSARVYHSDATTVLKIGAGSFNSGANTEIWAAIRNADAETSYFDSIILTEGTTAPTTYLSCDLQRFVIEGQFTDDDTVTVKDGQVSGLLNWKHRTLYGKDYDWIYAADGTGWKRMTCSYGFPIGLSASYGAGNTHFVKNNGDIVRFKLEVDESNTYAMGNADATKVHIAVADTDTGFAESIAPNSDEVKAFMNGWKATANDGTRYTAWVSVVDGVTVPTAQTIDFVKANIASGYEGYRLHYKLANPEPITDVNVHVHGSIWGLVPGDNYVTVDSGMVLEEVANPINVTSNYFINDNRYADLLQYKAETIFHINKNSLFDSLWTLDSNLTYTYGNLRAYTAVVNFNVNAVYTVKYQILKTLHVQSFGNLAMQYAQDVFSSITAMGKALEEKQQKNISLDSLVDLSIYEEFKSLYIVGRWLRADSTAPYICYLQLKMSPKKAVPVINLKANSGVAFNGSGSYTTIPLSNILIRTTIIDTNNLLIYATYVGTDATIQSNLLAYGGWVNVKVIADCRGRI